jgi:hypothetical protein
MAPDLGWDAPAVQRAADAFAQEARAEGIVPG